MTNTLPSDYQSYIHISRYARWLDDKNRRETWEETVDRYKNYWIGKFPFLSENELYLKAINGIMVLENMPSMRTLMTAGVALDRDNVAGYNCSYLSISGEGEHIQLEHDKLDEPLSIHLSKPIDLDEAMYILMCGTGVGFSVERQYINQLPTVGKKLNRRMYLPNNKNYPNVPKEELSAFDKKENTIVVHDSKYGWASAFRILIVELYNGNFEVKWDVSQLRPAGARLKTFGGRSSGPDPLVDLFVFCVGVFGRAMGRKLTSIECHDLTCKVADIVVVGGVRRSALIGLSNLTDERMRTAKSGHWWVENGQRTLANNSVCYTEKPDIGIFMREWESLYSSKAGERGIFNRVSAQKTAKKNGRRDATHDFGTNPCSEIILRSKQFCNLSEVVVRPDDTFETLKEKIISATILGTLQSTLTDFKYLNEKWKKNTEEERLLGVSLTGIMDHPVLNGKDFPEMHGFENHYDLNNILQELKQVAIDTNKEWAEKIGIQQSAAITCVKPSGTVSQLVNCASGIHSRHSEYYIRTVRQDKKDPLAQMMVDFGFPHEDDITKPDSTYVFSFPVKAPENSIMRDDMTAIEQLKMWKIYQENWCEHKPSITVHVKEPEWMKVGAWVYENFDDVSGVSFLPHTEHNYRQAPFQEITKEEFEEMYAKMPKNIDWSALTDFEKVDTTTGTQEYACSSGTCDIL